MEYVSKYNKINVAGGLSPSRGSGGQKTPYGREVDFQKILSNT